MHEDTEQGSENDLPASTIGVDMDFVDMKLYDTYRQIDRTPHSQEYLLKCRSKLTNSAYHCSHKVMASLCSAIM